MVWPPDLDKALDGGDNVINYEGMPPRVQELVFYMHHKYYFTAECGVQLIDGNYGLKRLVHWNGEKYEATVFAPWKYFARAITSKLKMIIRLVNEAKVVELVRLIAGEELMLFMGWPRARVEQLYPYSHSSLSRFAGAAFNGFSLIPVFSTAIFGAGLARLTGDVEQDLCTSNTEEFVLARLGGPLEPKKKGKAKAKGKAKDDPTKSVSNASASNAEIPPADSTTSSGSD